MDSEYRHSVLSYKQLLSGDIFRSFDSPLDIVTATPSFVDAFVSELWDISTSLSAPATSIPESSPDGGYSLSVSIEPPVDEVNLLLTDPSIVDTIQDDIRLQMYLDQLPITIKAADIMTETPLLSDGDTVITFTRFDEAVASSPILGEAAINSISDTIRTRWDESTVADLSLYPLEDVWTACQYAFAPNEALFFLDLLMSPPTLQRAVKSEPDLATLLVLTGARFNVNLPDLIDTNEDLGWVSKETVRRRVSTLEGLGLIHSYDAEPTNRVGRPYKTFTPTDEVVASGTANEVYARYLESVGEN